MDFSLDPTIVQAAHDERVRQAERAFLVWEARRDAAHASKGANWLLRGWRRWRGQLTAAASSGAARATR